MGRIDAIGAGVAGPVHRRAGRHPLAGPHLRGCARIASVQRENLCDRPLFTGYTRDGGFATAVIADARFAFPLGEAGDDVALAPLLCAGLIGWRSLVIAGEGKRLGLYGFGAAAHILAQVARWQGRSVFAFTRPGDTATQAFARSLGASWAGRLRRDAAGAARCGDHLRDRPASSCRWRCRRCARAGAWSARAST